METLRSCEVYHPDKDVWLPAASLQVARSGSRVVALGDRHLLAVGGCDDVFGRAETQPTAELFDPRIGVWQVLSEQLAQPRTTAGVAAVDDRRVIVFGGAPSLASAEVYHVAEFGSAPGPAVVADVTPRRPRGDDAGPDDSGEEEEDDDNETLDDEADYRLVANLPVGRMGCQAAAVRLPGPSSEYPTADRLCIAVVGGERCNTKPNEWPRVQQFSSVPVFDVEAGAWVAPDHSPIPPLPSPRTAVALCVGVGRVSAPPYATWGKYVGKVLVDIEEEEAATPRRGA